jgi:twitching motility protein PilT
MDREKFYRLLRLGIEKGASDIHFQVGNLPLYRFNGNLVELRYKVLAGEDTEEIARLLLESDERGTEMAFNELDLAYELPGEGRFRVNISRQRGTFAIVMRVIASKIPTVADVKLPPVRGEAAALKNGIVLVTGPTGSGKSSTLAAIIDLIADIPSDSGDAPDTIALR